MASFPDPRVQKYLGIINSVPSEDPARLLLDVFVLRDKFLSDDSYSDFSFLVLPASKALEMWILKLAKDLGIYVDNSRAGIARDQIESHLNKVLDSVEKKVGDSIRLDIGHLRNTMQECRHDIVHYSGKKITSAEMARNKITVICDRINTVTQKLIESGVLIG